MNTVFPRVMIKKKDSLKKLQKNGILICLSKPKKGRREMKNKENEVKT